MRIYLLNPPYFPHFGREMRWQDTGRSGTLYYPIWLSYAAAALEKDGPAVRLVDAPAWNWKTEKIIEDIGLFKPHALVVSTSFTSLDNDLAVTAKIKQAFPVKTIFVGPPCSQFAGKILKAGIDIVAANEYMLTLPALMSKVANAEQIDTVAGISFLDREAVITTPARPWTNTKDLDDIPFVSGVYKRHLHVKDYFLNYSLYPMVQLFAGVGCPFQCTFCSWPQSYTGHKYRVRSISNILDEMEWIQMEMPQVKEVFFEDDTFTIDKKRVTEFCDQYIQRKLHLCWSCNARVDTLDLTAMRKMKSANCRYLIVGFESADDRILQNIKKGITVEGSRRFVKDVQMSGLFLHADFIIGLPGETADTIRHTQEFIKEIKPEQLQVSVASPFPGTEFYDWAKANNFLITDNPNEYLDAEGHQKSIISYPGLSSDRIVKAVDQILMSYYFSVSYIPIAFGQIWNKRGVDEINRLWKSAFKFLQYMMVRK